MCGVPVSRLCDETCHCPCGVTHRCTGTSVNQDTKDVVLPMEISEGEWDGVGKVDKTPGFDRSTIGLLFRCCPNVKDC